MESSQLDFQSRMVDSHALNELPDHSGQPRPKQVEFFAEPPTEIGKPKSAESTLRPGREPMPVPMRLLIVAVAGGAFVFGGYWLGRGASQIDREIFQVLGWVFGIIALGIALLLTRFKVVCSFVGESGTATFTLKGRRNAKPKAQVLRFSDVEELRAKQTRQYVNGVYVGTYYDYTWIGPGGRHLSRTRGNYRQRKKGLRPGEPFRFVQAAEIAWSEFFLERANQTLKTEGSISFRVDNKRVVRVGPGFIEFHFGGEPKRFTSDEIASVSLDNGTFQFKHKDTKWYSLSGRYSFQYGNMANARIFLLALEKLMGYQWT
jgi:hypothetical protein